MLLGAIGWCLMTQGQVTLIVDEVPANTPAGADIFVAGNFQGWAPGDSAYRLVPDSTQEIYQLTVSPGAGSMSFKFTRGSWTTVESDMNGNFIPNRSHTPSGVDTLYLQIAGWEDLQGGGGPPGTPGTAAPNVHLLSDSFYISTLNRYRRVWIYLPPDYDSTSFSYPVLYMHDGQNVFDSQTAFAGEWEVDETLNSLHAAGDSGIIVVAIANGEASRTAEYTPWSHPTYGGGEGATYLDFMVQELKPFIDSAYRTLPDRAHTGIMGSSLGGLISTYAGLRYPGIFGRIGSFSPAYWINPEIYPYVSSEGKGADMKIYQLAGALESASMIPNMLKMEDSLHAAGFASDEVLSVEKGDGQHSEWFWAREFEAAYRWLFRPATTAVLPTDKPLASMRLYPNPVQDQMEVAFELPKGGAIQIEIVDSLGRSRWLLSEQVLPAGKQRLQLNLQSLQLPPGSYFCQLTTAAGRELAPFILLE